MRGLACSYVLVWHRGQIGAAQGVRSSEDQARFTLSIPHLRNTRSTSNVLFPVLESAEVVWDDARGDLTVGAARAPSACLIGLRQS